MQPSIFVVNHQLNEVTVKVHSVVHSSSIFQIEFTLKVHEFL